MSVNLHNSYPAVPAHALPGKGKARIAVTAALAAVRRLAHACAAAWALAHRTRREMRFSDEGGTAIHASDD